MTINQQQRFNPPQQFAPGQRPTGSSRRTLAFVAILLMGGGALVQMCIATACIIAIPHECVGVPRGLLACNISVMRVVMFPSLVVGAVSLFIFARRTLQSAVDDRKIWPSAVTGIVVIGLHTCVMYGFLSMVVRTL